MSENVKQWLYRLACLLFGGLFAGSAVDQYHCSKQKCQPCQPKELDCPDGKCLPKDDCPDGKCTPKGKEAQ
jgi:hypothetical protein